MTVQKTYHFEASHQLPRHPGKCKRLHGHSYEVTVHLEGTVNQDTGFVMDFDVINQIMNPIISVLDHQHLNFILVYPSSENIAAWLGGLLWPLISRVEGPGRIYRITVVVSETQRTAAVWESNGDGYGMIGSPGAREVNTPWVDICGCMVEVPDELGETLRRALNEMTRVIKEYKATVG